MEFHKSGRFGRIVKNMIQEGFEDQLEYIFYDSMQFSSMGKKEKVKYIEEVIQRLDQRLGHEVATKILKNCGRQCCGKSWANFVTDIHDATENIDDFFILLNEREAPYNTVFDYHSARNEITITRQKCLCGLIDKAKRQFESNLYCACSTGHFEKFFDTVFSVEGIRLNQSILTGAKFCEWTVKIDPTKGRLSK